MTAIEITIIPDTDADYELLVDHPLRPVIIQLVSSSRSYRIIPLWRRIENQFGQKLSVVGRTVLENKDVDLDQVLSQAMSVLSLRLKLTLE